MEAGAQRRGAITPLQRALVIVALAANGVMLMAAMLLAPDAVLWMLPLGAPPAVLFALERRPGAFRVVALVLGLGYVVFAVASASGGGRALVPAGLALLAAAAVPGYAAARRPFYIGIALAAAVLVAAVLASYFS